MNCREFQELISAAVDRYLKGVEGRLFEDHASKCSPCRHAYENELQTKTLVHNRVRMVQTPKALAAAITGRVDQEAEGLAGSVQRSRSNPLSFLIARPFLVAGVALVAVVLIITQPTLRFWESSPESVPETDIIRQSLANYQAMLGGSVKPQLISSEPANLKEFFAGKTDFAVHVPVMKECTLIGGSLNDLGSERVAHVVYQRSSGIIYVYQVCREMAMKGDQLSLPDNVRGELQRTGWFTQTLSDGDALVLWTRGGTLCTAVARMSPDELVAILQSEERSEPW